MGAGLAVDGPKQNSPGRSRGCIASNRSLALAAVLAAALSGLLLAALSGLLALLARLLLPAAALLLTAVLAALLLLATTLATLIGIVHDHSCKVKPPTQQRPVTGNVPIRQMLVMICLFDIRKGSTR